MADSRDLEVADELLNRTATKKEIKQTAKQQNSEKIRQALKRGKR